MDQAKSVSATFTHIPYSLSVSVSGSGNVTSSPSGIDCGSTCSAKFNSGTQVTLTASPASGWTFSNWGGACSGNSATCALTISGDTSVSATFTQITYPLSVSIIGSGGGKVTSTPSGIDCGSTCSTNFSYGTQVTLAASPANGWGISGWGGACSGIASTCTIVMDAGKSVSSTFLSLFSVVAAPIVVAPSGDALPPPIIGPFPQ
jgi:hypothetical protein